MPSAEPTPRILDAAGYRDALAQYATGVAIVTTRAPDGAPVGLTVNSFASVSLDPPLVLWSLGRQSAMLGAFVACERFRIEVLAAHQLAVADRCASRLAGRFEGPAWQASASGLPALVDGGVAWFECTRHAQHDGGDHVILVGRVESFGRSGGAALVFHDHRYRTGAWT